MEENLNKILEKVPKLNEKNLTNNSESENELKLIDKKRVKLKNMFFKKLLGYFLLLFVVACTVLSAIWIKDTINKDVKPFLFSYLNYSFLSILIIIAKIKKKIIAGCSNSNEQTEALLLVKTNEESFSENYNKIEFENKYSYYSQFQKMCVILMLLWFGSNSLYNKGLYMVSVTTSNAITNSNIIFIFLLKFILFKKKCSVYKILGLILCIAGVIVLGFFQAESSKNDGKEKEDTLLGSLILLIGSFLYALYSIYLKYVWKKHRYHFDMMEVFGYIGFYTALIIPVILLLLHIFYIEELNLPTLMSILYIFLNCLIAGCLSDLCQSYCITLLSPHIVSFGMTLTIPLSYTWDILKENIEFNLFYLIGTLLIFSSVCIIFVENYFKYLKKKEYIQHISIDKSLTIIANN